MITGFSPEYIAAQEARIKQLDNLAKVFRETTPQEYVISEDSPRILGGGNNLVAYSPKSIERLKTAKISYNDPRKCAGQRIWTVRFN